nr:vacuolar amino acid transporter 3 [Quercus suber]
MADAGHNNMSPDSHKPRPIPPQSPSQHHRTISSLSGSPSRASTTARLATPIQGSPSRKESPAPASKPADQQAGQEPLAGATGSSLPGPGTSSLSQALKGGLSQSPTRSSSRQHRSSVQGTARYESPDPRGQRAGYDSFAPSSYGTQLGRSPRGTEDIEVLKRHLAGPQGDSEPGSFRAGPSGAPDSSADDEFSSLQLQGGDTTRHIYRYAEKREREQAEQDGPGRLRRSLSVSLPKRDEEQEDDDISVIQMPGGFRRDHIRRTAGSPAPSTVRQQRPDYGTSGRAFTEPPRHKPQFIANNFIEFLTLYGHFAGETLDEDDEVLEPDEYFSSDAYDESTATGGEDGERDDDWGETSALLTPGKRRRKKKSREGKGTPVGAAMLLLKSFVGTGVLFLPRAYLNGGMLFSNLVLLGIACLSYYCFILLVTTRLKVRASFGDMGGRIYGNHFRNLINASLVISQIGFSSAYIVFVSENLQAFILAVSNCRTKIDIEWVILMQMVIFLPLSLYRNINNIQKLALIADLFICLGLIYLYYYDVKTIVHQGGIADIHNFNSHDWTLFIGTAIFTFEGIGLVIPIQSGMKDPAKFPRVLATVMVIISVIFISAGAISYAAYGSNTKTVILLNMPQDNALVNTVQLIYSLAILMSTPLQIYPAIEITSQQLFSKTGKYNPWIKWQKNVFRFFMVMLCAGIAWAGANDLDKFVSIVGSFACIPLVFLYPPLMHYRAVATRSWQKIADVLIIVFGFAVMIYTTALTIKSWANGDDTKTPGYCDDR